MLEITSVTKTKIPPYLHGAYILAAATPTIWSWHNCLELVLNLSANTYVDLINMGNDGTVGVMYEGVIFNVG